MIEARDYASDEDLRAMQGLLQELWAIERERTLAHIGDLAWGMAMHVNGVGEFEPVGTHPSYQRRGLGRAICSHALGRRTRRALDGRSCTRRSTKRARSTRQSVSAAT